MGEAGGRDGLEAFLARWLAGPLFAHLTPEQADLPARRLHTPAGLAASLRTCGAGAEAPRWDRLGELSMPVLVVVGERDERFRRIGEDLVAGIGENADLAVVPGAGHAVPFEAPGAFLALLEASLPPAARPAGVRSAKPASPSGAGSAGPGVPMISVCCTLRAASKVVAVLLPLPPAAGGGLGDECDHVSVPSARSRLEAALFRAPGSWIMQNGRWRRKHRCGCDRREV